ncbi:hypothetical protein E4U43_001558 [Claviceps pusilla]|uniref:Geranylgeranyl pyrophosphate synthetase n=1 Tax=Claviceps pusilla TaxID=123648 RepID=A0A9P7NA42_9HYPO|nr:hypothetical protein E4U43_001558 [Claviceps pusilla]
MASHKLSTITRSSLQHLTPSGDAYITNVKSLSSYSWIDTPKPTIAVPGCPPLWNPPEPAPALERDSGLYYIAENAVRLPASPIEPMFRALYVTNPSFDLRSIDVISGRHHIRKLLSFINPGSMRGTIKAFTMKLELVRNTLLLCPHDAPATEYIAPHDFRGYGHEFEKVYTTSQIADSTSHHRIISYRFCGLNIMIRHETDAYVNPRGEAVDSGDGLSDRLDSPPLSPAEKPSPAANNCLTELTVLQEGKTIPLESTLEIKTRSASKRLPLHDAAAQLWVSQTPKLVRAYHHRARFLKPPVEDVRAEIQAWEHNNQENLRTLGALINKIIMVMKECGGRGRLQYDVATDSLLIFRDEGAGMLPDDLYSKWDE